MRRFALLLTLAACAACDGGDAPRAAARAYLPPSDDIFRSLPEGAPAEDLAAAVRTGLSTETKGPDFAWFVVLRAADRHPLELRDKEFHCVIGAGASLPAGAMRIRHDWKAAGVIDGVNEQLQTMGISVAVERGAPTPFPQATLDAAARFCAALAAEVPLHPDCVVAMGQVPYANGGTYDEAERALADAARARVPVPAPAGRVVVVSGGKRLPVDVEIRGIDRPMGRNVGMMMRRGFDGPNRGMYFIYKHPRVAAFWMKNCFIPIDIAYVRDDTIEDIQTGQPGALRPATEQVYYEPRARYNRVLEMPGGWFAEHGIGVGDRVEPPE